MTKGLRKESRLSLWVNFFEIVRRLVLLYVAMFLASYAWFQIIVFMSFSLISMIYLGYTKPYKVWYENKLYLFNESCTLFVSYLVMGLVGVSGAIEAE